jgi:transcriptional regulator with XRE-family HTH domain
MGEAGIPGVASIGARIRAERQRRGETVRGLARDIGVSASLISQIETGKSLPSVSTLYAITTALRVPVDVLFDPAELDRDGDGRDAARPPARGFAHAVGLSAPDRNASAGPHLRPGGREILTLDTGVTWEWLGQIRGHHVDFLQITYGPGSTSASGGELMRHAGMEYGYLMSGELVLTLGVEERRLTAGDSVCFESATPHGYRNDGDIPAVGIWFVHEDG